VENEAVRTCREGGPRGCIQAAGGMVPPMTPLADLRDIVAVARKSFWREGRQA